MKMLNLDKIKEDRFKVTIDGETIEVNPPKRGIINRVMVLAKSKTETGKEVETLNELYEVVGLILSSNKAGQKYDINYVEKHFNLPKVNLFLMQYLKWVNEIMKDKSC